MSSSVTRATTTPCATSSLPRIDLATLPASESGLPLLELLQGRPCPAILFGGRDIKQLLSTWSSSRILKDGASPQVAVEAMRDGNNTFTYWDDNTVLSKAVRALNDVGGPPDHREIVAPGTDFMDSIFSSASTRATKSGVLGARARYGGPVHKFSMQLARDFRGQTLGPPSAKDAARVPSLFASAAGITCTAHFDNFLNVHLVVLGSKRVRLAPPSAAFDLLVRPGAHPSARQARCSLATPNASPCAYEGEVLEATLSRGEALFIPSGWFHEFEALKPSVAVSLTANIPEWTDFGHWASKERGALVPFITPQSVQGGRLWTPQRFASTLIVFVPALLEALGLIGDGEDPAAASSAGFLRATFLRQYGHETRADAGLYWQPEEAHPWSCEAAVGPDEENARAAAQVVAQRLLTRYRDELRPLYLMLYLENVLSYAAPKYEDRGVEARFAAMLEFVDLCLAPEQSVSEPATATPQEQHVKSEL